MAEVEKASLVLELLLQVYLVYQVSEAVDLYLLDLVSVFCYLLILWHVLYLKLTFDIELKCLHKVFT